MRYAILRIMEESMVVQFFNLRKYKLKFIFFKIEMVKNGRSKFGVKRNFQGRERHTGFFHIQIKMLSRFLDTPGWILGNLPWLGFFRVYR